MGIFVGERDSAAIVCVRVLRASVCVLGSSSDFNHKYIELEFSPPIHTETNRPIFISALFHVRMYECFIQNYVYTHRKIPYKNLFLQFFD